MNQKYAFGVKVMFLFLLLNFQSTGQDRTSKFENQFNIRPISEINAKGFGDAYPWISNDGLRLYYTSQDINDNNSCIWSASRPDIYSAFDSFTKLDINDTHADNLASWLSPDELTIAFVKRKRKGAQMTSIMMANRTNIEESYSEPVMLDIKGPVKGTLLSPSFTDDLSELILYNEYKSQKFLLVFHKTDSSTYTFNHKINIPEKYTIKTGKLSQDGLSYYISLEHRNAKPNIYLLTRKTAKDKFDKLVPIKNTSLNTKEDRNHQPHFSNDQKFVVFTRSEKNHWKHNEIFIGQLEAIGKENAEVDLKENPKDQMQDLVLYPNPSASFVSISNPRNRNLNAKIYNTQGQLVMVLTNEKMQHQIEISNLDPGSYIFKVEDQENGRERIFRVLKIQ